MSHAVPLAAALETYASGSPVRVWVIGIAAGYALAASIAWRLRGWRPNAGSAVAALFAMAAITAWLPGGLSAGIRLATMSTSTVLSLMAAAASVMAAAVFTIDMSVHRTVIWMFKGERRAGADAAGGRTCDERHVGAGPVAALLPGEAAEHLPADRRSDGRRDGGRSPSGSTRTQLIRKVFEDTVKGTPAGSFNRTTITYEPQANPTLDDAKFRFTVPGQ